MPHDPEPMRPHDLGSPALDEHVRAVRASRGDEPWNQDTEGPDMPRAAEWYRNECEFCDQQTARRCPDEVCRERKYGEGPDVRVLWSVPLPTPPSVS